MKNVIEWFTHPPFTEPSAVIFIRLMAGGVFLWEGIIKFMFANQGVVRFTKIGFPIPGVTASFVGAVEIVGGLFLIFGLLTRITSFYFVVQMLVAVITTKVTMILGYSPIGMPGAPPTTGIWAMLHEVRADYAQIMTSMFLLIAGPGKKSLDFKFFSTK